MARPSTSDYFHSMRFFVEVADGNYNPFEEGGNPSAGFSAVTTPEATMDAVEYREGHLIYTRKQPGLPTMSEITMSRGVVKIDTTFYDWMAKTIEGTGQYRTDLIIDHFHRDALPGRTGSNNPNSLDIKKDAVPVRKYHVMEAFPIRCKVAGDLDATASDISISEMDVAYENFYMSNS